MGHTEWAGATLWAAGTMWLLPGVQLLRALRMSHRLTCFTFPLALAVCLVFVWVFVVGLCVGLVFVLVCFSCFASAWGCFDLLPASSR